MWGEIMVPIPSLKNVAGYHTCFAFFDFGLQQTYKSYLFLMGEDFDIFLLMGPVKAPYILATELFHGGGPPPSVL